jgi:predicted RNA methylase
MLSDEVRMEAYRCAMITTCNRKIVLDVGTGSGALAKMAARAGAHFVHAVEASAMAFIAADSI